MKNNLTMLKGLMQKYRYDSSNYQFIDGQKYVFVDYDKLIDYYLINGFDVLSKKKCNVLDRHLDGWEFIGCAKRTVIDGTIGILIPLSTAQ